MDGIQVLEGDGAGAPIGHLLLIPRRVPISHTYEGNEHRIVFHREEDFPTSLINGARAGTISIHLVVEERVGMAGILIPGLDIDRLEVSHWDERQAFRFRNPAV